MRWSHKQDHKPWTCYIFQTWTLAWLSSVFGPVGRLFICGKAEKRLMTRWEQRVLKSDEQTENLSHGSAKFMTTFIRAKGLVTHTDCRQICMCMRAHSHMQFGGKIRLSGCVSLPHLFWPLHLCFLFICLSQTHSLATSHKPLGVWYALQKGNIFT